MQCPGDLEFDTCQSHWVFTTTAEVGSYLKKDFEGEDNYDMAHSSFRIVFGKEVTRKYSQQYFSLLQAQISWPKSNQKLFGQKGLS